MCIYIYICEYTGRALPGRVTLRLLSARVVPVFRAPCALNFCAVSGSAGPLWGPGVLPGPPWGCPWGSLGSAGGPGCAFQAPLVLPGRAFCAIPGWGLHVGRYAC